MPTCASCALVGKQVAVQSRLAYSRYGIDKSQELQEDRALRISGVRTAEADFAIDYELHTPARYALYATSALSNAFPLLGYHAGTPQEAEVQCRVRSGFDEVIYVSEVGLVGIYG